MFCHKCGSKLSDSAVFCSKCGAKVLSTDTDQNPLNTSTTEEEPNNADAGATTKVSPQTVNEPQAAKKEFVQNNDKNNFKEFVDNHVRATTNFQSADELLNSHMPMWSAWLGPIVPAILIGILSFLRIDSDPLPALLVAIGISLFFFAIFDSIAFLVFAVKKTKYVSKFSGKFSGNIDIKEIISFLDKRLSYLSPYFHEWGVLEQSGYDLKSILVTSLETALSETFQELRLCTEFGNRTNFLVLLYLRPDPLNQDSGQKEYFIDVKRRISWGVSPTAIYTCVFKTAPILQAAMEYYLHHYKSDSEQQTPNAFETVSKQKEDSTATASVQTTVTTVQQEQNVPKEASKKKKLPIIVGVVALAFIAVLFVIFNWEGKIDYEATVRDHHPFTVQGRSYTYGEVLDKYILDAEWKVRESDDATYVDISGKAKGTDKTLVVTIKVTPDSDNPDTALISPESITINDVTSPTQNDAEKFMSGMFWMYDEGYDEISDLFSDTGGSSNDGQTQATAGIADEDEWRKAYSEKVRELGSEYYFKLIYLDEDAIPELVADYPGYFVSVWTWKQGTLFTILDSPYGAGGNLGYEYLPGGNIIYNANNDLAGAIQYEDYMTVNDEFELVSLYEENLSIWYFKDANGNYQIDEGESYIDDPYYYYGDTEITAEEYSTYKIPGDYEFIEGTWSAGEMLLQLGNSNTDDGGAEQSNAGTNHYVGQVNSMEDAKALVENWLNTHPIGSAFVDTGAAANDVTSISDEYYVLNLWSASQEFIGLVYVRKSDGYMTFHDTQSVEYDLNSWYEEQYQ